MISNEIPGLLPSWATLKIVLTLRWGGGVLEQDSARKYTINNEILGLLHSLGNP
jgi:hypothetical protein